MTNPLFPFVQLGSGENRLSVSLVGDVALFTSDSASGASSKSRKCGVVFLRDLHSMLQDRLAVTRSRGSGGFDWEILLFKGVAKMLGDQDFTCRIDLSLWLDERARDSMKALLAEHDEGLRTAYVGPLGDKLWVNDRGAVRELPLGEDPPSDWKAVSYTHHHARVSARLASSGTQVRVSGTSTTCFVAEPTKNPYVVGWKHELSFPDRLAVPSASSATFDLADTRLGLIATATRSTEAEIAAILGEHLVDRRTCDFSMGDYISCTITDWRACDQCFHMRLLGRRGRNGTLTVPIMTFLSSNLAPIENRTSGRLAGDVPLDPEDLRIFWSFLFG